MLSTTRFPSFEEFYKEVRTFPPYQWQKEAAKRIYAGEAPQQVHVGTGMGKSDLVTCWVWALAKDLHRLRTETDPAVRRVPLRLHFVVDRRLIVDAVADLGEHIAKKIEDAETAAVRQVADELAVLRPTGTDGDGRNHPLLKVVRLRGGMQEKAEHVRSVTQPALVTSTLDMFGSRLLWRGYGVRRHRRPIDAALTGIDTLVVLDEAHLVPQLIQTLDDIKLGGWRETQELRCFPVRHVVVSTATPTSAAEKATSISVDYDAESQQVRDKHTKRSNTKLVLAPLQPKQSAAGAPQLRNGKTVMESVVDRLVAEAELRSPAANGELLLVMANTIATVNAIAAKLRENKKSTAEVVTLIGGMPVPVMGGALDKLTPYKTGNENRASAAPMIVVATQTLEVGADIDANNLVTQAASYGAIVQRCGRVNRGGKRDEATVVIVYGEPPLGTKENPVYGSAQDEFAAWAVKERFPTVGAMIAASAALSSDLRSSMETPHSAPIRLTRYVFDTLLDTCHDTDGIPSVSHWLRAENDTPQVNLVFRDALTKLTTEEGAKQYMTLVPPRGWETWTLSLTNLADTETLKTGATVAVVERDGTVTSSVVPSKEADVQVFLRSLAGKTVALPSAAYKNPVAPRFGTDLSAYRCNNEPPTILANIHPDDSDLIDEQGTPHPARADVISDASVLPTPTTTLALLAEASTIEGFPLEDYRWLWIAPHTRGREDAGRTQLLETHHRQVANEVQKVAYALRLPTDITTQDGDTVRLVEVLVFAAAHHDLGKTQPGFKAMLYGSLDKAAGQPDRAKSGMTHRDAAIAFRRARASWGLPEGFEHEAMSAALARPKARDAGFNDAEVELIIYLILTHHGDWRGLGPTTTEPVGVDDTRNTYQDTSSDDWMGWPNVIAKLQARFGPYTLAMLESILRLADWECSADPIIDREQDTQADGRQEEEPTHA